MDLKTVSKFIGKTPALLKSKFRPGDRVLIKTQNSIYELHTTNLKKFSVSVGVFECREEKQVQTTVTGCTWGGTCVKFDAVALEKGYSLLEIENDPYLQEFRKVPDFLSFRKSFLQAMQNKSNK